MGDDHTATDGRRGPGARSATALDVGGAVVVGVDGSRPSDRALQWAAGEAAARRRRLVVVHASPHDGPHDGGTALLRSPAHHVAALAARASHPGLEVVPAELRGDPREVLVALGRTARLLVVGARGAGPFRTALLGSTAAAVSRHVACPVVVTRPPAPSTRPQPVVVGLRGPTDAGVLDFGLQLAARRGQPVRLVHSDLEPRGGPRAGAVTGRAPVEVVRRALHDLAEVRSPELGGVEVTVEVVHGSVVEALADQCDASVTVIGRAPGSFGRPLTGLTAAGLLERSLVPVAVVPLDRADACGTRPLAARDVADLLGR